MAIAYNILIILGIVLLGFVITNLLQIKNSFGPILSIALSMSILEIGGALGMLWPISIIYCCTVFLGSIIYILCFKKHHKQFQLYIANPIIIGFVVASLLYMVLSYKQTLFFWKCDSFLHWGLFFKAVFYEHNFDIYYNDFFVNHRSYPHGMAAWYSIFALGKDVFSEGDVMLSINTILFASACPIVDSISCKMHNFIPNSKKLTFILKSLFSTICIACLFHIWDFGDTISYVSGYMDIPLGVVFMASLCLAISHSNNSFQKAIALSLITSMLVMIKPSGVLFFGITALLWIIIEYCNLKERTHTPSLVSMCKSSAIVVSIPMLELLVWSVIINHLGLSGDDQFAIKNFGIGTVISNHVDIGEQTSSFTQIVINFIKVFFTRPISLHIPAFVWGLICISISIFAYWKSTSQTSKNKIKYSAIYMVIMFFLYNMFLLWTYLTTMSEGEALGVVCYSRYMGAFIIAWFLFNIYYLFESDLRIFTVYRIIYGITGLSCAFAIMSSETLIRTPDESTINTYNLSTDILGCIPQTEKVSMQTAPNLWISFATEEEALSEEEITQLHYYLFPNFNYVNVNSIQKNYHQEMKDIVEYFDFDYIVLYGVNDEFYNSYYWFFSDGLSSVQEAYNNKQIQVYKAIRSEETNEFWYFEPI